MIRKRGERNKLHAYRVEHVEVRLIIKAERLVPCKPHAKTVHPGIGFGHDGQRRRSLCQIQNHRPIQRIRDLPRGFADAGKRIFDLLGGHKPQMTALERQIHVFFDVAHARQTGVMRYRVAHQFVMMRAGDPVDQHARNAAFRLERHEALDRRRRARRRAGGIHHQQRRRLRQLRHLPGRLAAARRVHAVVIAHHALDDCDIRRTAEQQEQILRLDQKAVQIVARPAADQLVKARVDVIRPNLAGRNVQPLFPERRHQQKTRRRLAASAACARNANPHPRTPSIP